MCYFQCIQRTIPIIGTFTSKRAKCTKIRAKSVGLLRRKYQWFPPLPIFIVDPYRTGTDFTIECNIETGVGRGNCIWIQELGVKIPSENWQKINVIAETVEWSWKERGGPMAFSPDCSPFPSTRSASFSAHFALFNENAPIIGIGYSMAGIAVL